MEDLSVGPVEIVLPDYKPVRNLNSIPVPKFYECALQAPIAQSR